MEKFKYNNFIDLYGEEFHAIKECPIPNGIRALSQCLSKLKYDNIYYYLETNGIKISDINAEDDGFQFCKLFTHLNVSPPLDINIIWDIKDNYMDSIPLTVFSQYFDDIWYPGADDIILYNQAYQYLIFIRHDGCIFVHPNYHQLLDIDYL